jgi:hypothetical protein
MRFLVAFAAGDRRRESWRVACTGSVTRRERDPVAVRQRRLATALARRVPVDAPIPLPPTRTHAPRQVARGGHQSARRRCRLGQRPPGPGADRYSRSSREAALLPAQIAVVVAGETSCAHA